MLKTGFTELDNNTGGMRNGDIYLVTAKNTFIGSVFLVNIACLLSEQHKVLYMLQGLSVNRACEMFEKRSGRGGRIPVSVGQSDNIVFKEGIPDNAGIADLMKQYTPDLLILDGLEHCSLENIDQLKQLAVKLNIPVAAQIPWNDTADDLLMGKEDVSIRMTLEEDSMVKLETIINPGGAIYPEGKYFWFDLKYLPDCCVMANVLPDNSGNHSGESGKMEENDGMAEHIYFDMDGVLADFDRGVRELCHMEPIRQGARDPVDLGSAPTGAERRSGPANDDRLWVAVRNVPHFYDKLEPIEGSVELFNAVYDRYGDNCQILTGIPKPRRGIVTAAEDKIRWAHRILSPDVKVNVVYREQKPEFCNGHQDVLIDDYSKNICEWQGYGGTGILFISAETALHDLRGKGIV